MATYDVQRNTNTTIAWLALIVAIVALLFAVVAFNRTGRNVGTVIQDETSNAVQKVQDTTDVAAMRGEVATNLAALRANVAAQEGYEGAADEVAAAKHDLNEAYQHASVDVREQWEDLQPQFDELEQDLRSGSANALEALDRVISSLQQDVRTDEHE